MNQETSQPSSLIQSLGEALRLSLELFKIMVPVIIAVKVLQELGLIRYLAMPLGPLMQWVGLPAEMGLVWATAMANNLYGAIIVFLSLVEESPVNGAQATVLCTMMLVAHALPVELRIAQASGTRLLFQAVLRIGSALVIGWLLKAVYSVFGLLQGPAAILFRPDADGTGHAPSLAAWAVGEVRTLLSIFIIITTLFLLMRILEKAGVIGLLNRLLRPVLKLLGIGPKASAIAVIGLTMGISYGGGLIIHEARSGRAHRKDIFYALTLMGLSHALIEDTLLMMTIGGDLSGILWGRLLFSLILVALLAKGTQRLSRDVCDRYLWGDGVVSGSARGKGQGGRDATKRETGHQGR
jgi:hypothetical protein